MGGFNGPQFGGSDALGLAAFAPGDYFAGIRQTSAARGGAMKAFTSAGTGSATVNVLGLALIAALLLALEHFRP